MQRLMKLIGRFRRNERGIAAVEFALIVPFLVTLYFGSLEGSALFTADKRVNSISSTIGDLVAQWDPDHDGQLSVGTGSTLQGYFDAATGLITPYSSTGVKIVVSLIYVDGTTGATKVIWSQATGGGTARTQGQAFPALSTTNSPQMNNVAKGGCVIASEVSYSYKPLLGVVFSTALNLSHTNYFIPRYGATNTIIVSSPTPVVLATSCTTGVYH